jgi:GMP reductase
MRIENDPKLDFDDVLIRPKRSTLSSRKEVKLERTFTFRNSQGVYVGVPIIAANMDHTGTIEVANAVGEFGINVSLHKHYTTKELVEFFRNDKNINFYSMGITPTDLQKFNEVKKEVDISYVCIDVANGYTEAFVDFIKRFREQNPETTIMAGNVVTGEMTEELILAGVDIVKVGIGPGSACTTRKLTGVGYPQLSSIIECADAAHGLGGHICADGGCKMPGDVAKAFGAGADFVMLGGMFAGHAECGGKVTGGRVKLKQILSATSRPGDGFNETNVIHFRGAGEYVFCRETAKQIYDNAAAEFEFDDPLLKQYPEIFDVDYEGATMEFYGMSSKTAMEKYSGGVAEYRASEGKTVQVPYRGMIKETIKEVLGGLRSACTYVGAKSLKEMSKRTTFVLVNRTHNRVFGD